MMTHFMAIYCILRTNTYIQIKMIKLTVPTATCVSLLTIQTTFLKVMKIFLHTGSVAVDENVRHTTPRSAVIVRRAAIRPEQVIEQESLKSRVTIGGGIISQNSIFVSNSSNVL